MDYSKFYLKNYVPELSDSDEKDDENKIVFPRIESRPQPEIIYINPDGEEFDPEFSSTESTEEYHSVPVSDKNSVDKEYRPKLSYVPSKKKQPQTKQSFINRFCQTVLLFAIVVMSFIVCADFVSNGKVIAAISDCFTPGKVEYYAVLTDPQQDLTTSKVNAYAMRLKGGAGFTVKNGDNYYNVYAVFDSKSEAETYINQNGGEIMLLSTSFYDNIEGSLKNYTDYPVNTCNELNKIAKQLIDKEISTAEALEVLNNVKEDFAVTYDNMNNVSKSDEQDKSITLLANASVTLSALEYLCDTTVSRPNLICDIRYTVCSILFTYCYSA